MGIARTFIATACLLATVWVTGATEASPDHADLPTPELAHAGTSQPRPPVPVRSVHIYSIRPEIPVSYGDERREPTPPKPIKSWSRHNPDWRCDEWIPLAREVGWPEELLPKLSYVMYRETRCRPDQHNPDDPMGGSNGLTQINQFWCKPTRYWPDGWLQTKGVLDHCDDLYDPRVSLEASLAIYRNSGWSPWGLSN